MKRVCKMMAVVATLGAAVFAATGASADPLPAQLAGTWRIVRVLQSSPDACWSTEQASPLVGSSLTYRQHAMRWREGEVPLSDIFIRSVDAKDFHQETAGTVNATTLERLGIHAPYITEVDLQHEDMNITGATTEVPGDTILMVAPNRIIVSACGVYFEARRGGAMLRTSARR